MAGSTINMLGPLSSAVLPPDAPQAIDPEWRLYGRSAADDKAGVMAILTAFDALHKRYPNSTWAKKTPYWFKD